MALLTRTNKITLSISLLIIICFIILGLIVVSSGGTKETVLSIPDSLQGSTISFDVPMYYQIGKPEQPTDTFQKIQRGIVPTKFLSKYYPDRFKYELVSTSTKFTIVKAVNEANYGWAAIDSSTRGVDYLILEDESGQQSYFPYMYFKGLYNEDGSITGSNSNVFTASYYKDGKKIGPVELDQK